MDRTLRPALVAEAIGTFLFFTVGAGAVVVTTYAAGGGGLVGVASGFTDSWYVWIVGPLAGAIAAGWLWRYVFAERA